MSTPTVGPSTDKIRIVHLQSFDASLTTMWKTGGQKKKIADKVFAVLGRLNLGMSAFKELQVTKAHQRMRKI
jgi:hypothetical protein